MNITFNTAVVIAITAGLLAILLTFTNKYLLNYKKVKIIVDDDTEYIVDGGNTLLESLTANGIQVPATCGGKGTCGVCKIKVISGGGDILPIEAINLKPEYLSDGYRLSCQLKVMDDIKIELPEDMIKVKQYECLVVDIESIDEIMKLIRLKLPEDNQLQFKPGQYIQLYSPVYPESFVEVHRNYSIASFDAKNCLIDLYIKYIPDGVCSTYIHKYLRLGDTVKLTGPYGKFNYKEADSPILMICTDNGYAAINSILEFITNRNNERNITLIRASDTENTVFCDRIINKFSDIDINLHKCTLINQDNIDILLKLINDNVSNYDDLDAYLCGNKELVKLIRAYLLKSGLPNDNINFINS